MKRIKLLNIFLMAIIFLNFFSFTATAQPVNELLDLYIEYSGNTDIIKIIPTSATIMYCNNYSCYNITKKLFDYCRITIPTDTEINIDVSELTANIKYPSDMFSVSCKFDKEFITVDYFTDNHNVNKVIAREIYALLKEKYEIDRAYICIYTEPASEIQAIIWENFYLKDELGHEVKTNEQLSKKQILSLREAIKSRNFADVAVVDDDGKIIVDEQVSDVKKLRFALWLKKEYGYYARIFEDVNSTLFYNPPTYEAEVMHYTELSGDVNNDNVIDVCDINMLRDYILQGMYSTETSKPYVCFNTKNADLTNDGVIDAFDLVLLRQQIIYSDD